jgi:hypothetical protein
MDELGKGDSSPLLRKLSPAHWHFSEATIGCHIDSNGAQHGGDAAAVGEKLPSVTIGQHVAIVMLGGEPALTATPASIPEYPTKASSISRSSSQAPNQAQL